MRGPLTLCPDAVVLSKRLIEKRERRLAALDRALERGIADVEAGRVHNADDVFDELDAKYARMAEERGGP